MYFDIVYWWRVVRHVIGLQSWPGRRRMLLRLLLLVPLASAFHALCFLLDYVFSRVCGDRR
jgi:cytochrome c oxidase assembly factor CtaG